MVGRRFGTDFPPCVTGCPRESPMWVTLTMGVKERKCGDSLVLRVQDGDFEEALSPPIQWRLEERKKSCQIVQMHQSPSQMVMESTTLSMIHRSECPNEKKGASES